MKRLGKASKNNNFAHVGSWGGGGINPHMSNLFYVLNQNNNNEHKENSLSFIPLVELYNYSFLI